MGHGEREPAARAGYRYFVEIPTRAFDLDQNGHVNQAIYYSFFETLIAIYLQQECEFESNRGELAVFCVENGCHYRRELNFPQLVEAGMRVAHIGNSSVRFETALFTAGEDEAAATGFFVDVFVDSRTRRPLRIPQHMREVFEHMRIK